MKKNYQVILQNTIEELQQKNIKPKLLLHSCCAPCSTYCIEFLKNYFDITIYYYNPNIDTDSEYELRSKEQQKYLDNINIKYVIEEYNNEDFEKISKGNEFEKEGGERCKLCYNLRLLKTAIFAKENGFDYFTTTLSISPYKNSYLLNELGEKIGNETNIAYLFADFKKNNGYKQSIELSKQ